MCCLFGLMDYGRCLSGRQKTRLLSVLAQESEARGTDASGIAYNAGGQLHIYKRPGLSILFCQIMDLCYCLFHNLFILS